MTTALAPLPLKYGSTGDGVAKIQVFLETLKLYSGSIDGVFGANTKQAVLQFQAMNGLTEDGIVGNNTAITLDIQAWGAQQPLIKEGSKGEGVRAFQEMYNNHFGTLTVDGIFGSKTKAAVIEFQRHCDLTADGIVGAKTWSCLYLFSTHDIPTEQRISFIFDEPSC